MEKGKFHITIKDNVTGETIADTDTTAVLASVHSSEEKAADVHFCVHADTSECVCVLSAAEEMIQEKYKEDPELAFMAQLNKLAQMLET